MIPLRIHPPVAFVGGGTKEQQVRRVLWEEDDLEKRDNFRHKFRYSLNVTHYAVLTVVANAEFSEILHKDLGLGLDYIQ